MASRFLHLTPEHGNLRVDISLAFELVQNLGGEFVLGAFECLRGPLDARLHARPFEKRNRFVMNRAHQRVAEFARAGIAVPWLLGHRLVHNLAQEQTHCRVHIRGRRRIRAQNGIADLAIVASLKRPPPRERFVTHRSQREDVREHGGRLELQQFRRHIGQRPAHGRLRGTAVGEGHAEIDDLYRIVGHDEHVIRLDVAVDQATLVRRLQTAADLIHDLNGSFHGQWLAGVPDEVRQRATRQKRHHKIRPGHAAVFELPDVIDFNDVRMRDRRLQAPFLIKQVERRPVLYIQDGLQRDIALHQHIPGVVDHAHAAFVQNFPQLVPRADCG